MVEITVKTGKIPDHLSSYRTRVIERKYRDFSGLENVNITVFDCRSCPTRSRLS